MPVADADVRAKTGAAGRIHEHIGFAGLCAVLAAFTLSTMDGGEIAPHAISAVTLLVAAYSLLFPLGKRFVLTLPAVCLLAMTCYGVAQTLWSPHRIVYNGWNGVLFWLTAAAITLLASQLFRNRELAARFRILFVAFGAAICVLDLLEQASGTNRYFWLIASKYRTINGTFAYWNNFAQFVELVLPITLWFGLGPRKPVMGYVLLSAVEIGAVVGSGSRAGTALVMAELLAMLLMSYLRRRNRKLLVAAAAVVALSGVFVYAAGFQKLSQKLEQRDQLNIRREIDKSSLAMIREHPFTGWGLDTYVPVYRIFARYDDGTFVNRAHNDWLQWAAEGGIPFAAVMAVVFVWSIRPGLRSGWGIGVIAVCLHALVDYPFARFGVCGWYFALIGMLAVGYEDVFTRRRVRTSE